MTDKLTLSFVVPNVAEVSPPFFRISSQIGAKLRGCGYVEERNQICIGLIIIFFLGFNPANRIKVVGFIAGVTSLAIGGTLRLVLKLLISMVARATVV